MSDKAELFYQNTRVLRTEIADGLRDRISLRKHKFIALAESWLNDSFASEEIFEQNLYTVHRADRNHRTYNTRPNTSTQTQKIRKGFIRGFGFLPM